jgi:hypothetical protein
MRAGISFTVSLTDRQRLLALIKDRNAPQKHVWRAQIILLIVIRTANTASENALNRSGVALAWTTVVSFAVRCR